MGDFMSLTESSSQEKNHSWELSLAVGLRALVEVAALTFEPLKSRVLLL